MRYKSFEIRNFRGIRHAKVELTPTGAGIFTLIGLNESGKTTVLEAISAFNMEVGEEKSLYSADLEEDPSTFVPKHEKYNFTGEVTITAEVAFEGNEKAICVDFAESKSDWKIDTSSIPDSFLVKRGYNFKNSDNTDTINEWKLNISARKGKSKTSKLISHDDPAFRSFRSMVLVQLPEIVYFPTFLFEQPEKIVLNPRADESDIDRIYRTVIQNVGHSLSKPSDIKALIVDRILTPDTPISQFAGLFGLTPNKQQQVESTVEELSHRLTETVFDSWSKVFGKSFTDREVRLKLGVDRFDDGSPRIYIQIGLKDGKQQYDISERSLGFRWFFSFLLFTLFRTSDKKWKKTLFLLDEPASNLHSSAQTQLMESFPRIIDGKNTLIYSTHSHYLVNPEWLDQAFIVSNLAINYEDFAGKAPPASRNTDISVEKYRKFVGENPDKTSYFQPVLDKLQVIPSRLDSLKPCVLVEGKGDYLVLEYGRYLCGIDRSTYAIIPTRGADHFDEIIGIFLGWGVDFALCFDDDPKGRKSLKEYVENWAVNERRAFTLGELGNAMSGKSIEGLLSKEDFWLVSRHYGMDKQPSKSQVQLFFSEQLALKSKIDLSRQFHDMIVAFDERVKLALGLV
jgi:predicted ATP-dependent endonuclease of OLD family